MDTGKIEAVNETVNRIFKKDIKYYIKIIKFRVFGFEIRFHYKKFQIVILNAVNKCVQYSILEF